MANRFYFPSTGTAAVSVTPSADWNKTTGAQTAKPLAVAGKTSTALANVANSENSASDYYRVLIQQHVSPPLNGNQAISGTYAMYIMGMEDNAAAEFGLSVIVRVVSNDGTTVRGTLLNGGLSSEWNTSLRNSGSNYNDLTLVNALNGDRIVVEIGFNSGEQVSTTLYTGTIRIGDTGATDLPENETDTTQTKVPWLQFDDVTLAFSAEAVSWIPKVIMV